MQNAEEDRQERKRRKRKIQIGRPVSQIIEEDDAVVEDPLDLYEYTYPLPEGTLDSRKWTKVLPMTLEELHQGKTFTYRFARHRDVLSLTSTDVSHSRSKKKPKKPFKDVTFSIVIPPGSPNRCKILFRNFGHERSDGTRQDLVFIVKEIEHGMFRRVGDDLYHDIVLPWREDLRKEPGEVFLTGVDGREHMFQINYKRDKGLDGTHIISRGGMRRKDGRRGNLIVR